jgi:hypothetical protein
MEPNGLMGETWHKKLPPQGEMTLEIMHGDNGKKRVHFIGKQNRERAEQFRFIEHGHIFFYRQCLHCFWKIFLKYFEFFYFKLIYF